MKETIIGLIDERGFVQEEKGNLAKINALKHEMLIGLLPKEEVEKHDM